ncbi:MAG: acyl--CoA ligase [Clostridia bacterium]|nr:acyl--CoA ligase [Clostridia bacterium]
MSLKPLHEKREFSTVREMIEDVGERFAGKVAFRYRNNPHDKEPVCVNYETLRDSVRAIATEMLDRGYKGKHIVVIGKHTYSWILTYFATLSMGAVLVPLDRDWSKEDLLDTVKNADAHCIFCDSDIAEKCKFIAENADLPAPIYLDGNLGESLADLEASGKEKFAASSEAYFGNEIDRDALALLVFTSGTTGKGKGVMLSQRNFTSDLAT